MFSGNLSLVGPRPHAVQGKLEEPRCSTKPSTAISPATASSPASPVGPRSTAGAGEIDNEEKIQKRVEFDLYYIENWSVLFDLYILIQDTKLALLKSENAY